MLNELLYYQLILKHVNSHEISNHSTFKILYSVSLQNLL